jgi:hypothetical protein
MTANQFPAWVKILDRMILSLPTTAAELPELRNVRDQMSRYLAHEEGDAAVIQEHVLGVARQHTDLLITAAEQVVNEVFRLIDPEIEQLRLTKQTRSLSDQDKADGRAYIDLLEECNGILEAMKQEQGGVPA